MIITKKHLPRRTFLRGVGATIALPLLEGMVPAFTPLAQSAARPVRRLGVVYLPNGMNMQKWTPADAGADFEFTQILQPLEPFRDRVVVLSGLSNKAADSAPGEGTGDHSRGQTAFLTGVHAKKTQGAAEAGISMDQIAANAIGQETQLASLELALEANDLAGGCDDGLSCAYSGTIAWRSAETPLPMEPNPRAVFERLFGTGGSTAPAARLARLRKNRSILDMVNEQLGLLRKALGPEDQIKLTEYVEAVRDVERRIQKAEEQSSTELLPVEQPGGIPASFEDYATLMFDLMALAYQSDLTRICTFLVGREKSVRSFPEIGVPEPHHPVSHHGNNPVMLEKLAKINVFHTKIFARFVEKLRTTRDGDGSLLDHTVMLYGAGLSDPNIHDHHELPILLAGGGAGRIKGGRHLRFAKDTPMSNLHVTVLEKLGVRAEQVGDSTERLADV
jgi:Protein of unknown function (DUF1552)